MSAAPLPEWSDPERRDAALERVAAVVLGAYPRRLPPTPAERRVLLCLSHGMTTAMCADVLGVSPETVKAHTRSVRYRLAAKDTTHAVALAIRAGIIP